MSSTLYVDNLIEKTSGNGVHIPGHVVQVAYSNSTGSSTSVATMTNSAANTATGFYADITPTSTSSKIVVLLTSNLQHTPSEGQGIIWGMRRNGSAIARNGASDYIEYGQQTNFHTTVILTMWMRLRQQAPYDMSYTCQTMAAACQ